MFINLVQKLGSKIKQENYFVDKYLTNKDLLCFLTKRILMVFRGLIFLRAIIFLGKRVEIYYKHRFKFGDFVSLHDGVELDALSKNGIIFGNKVSIGKNSFIRCTATLEELGDGLVIGDNVGIGSNAYLGCWGGVIINNNTIIGERFTVHSDNHNFSDKTVLIRHQGVKKLPVEIGENCWIGSNVTVLGGVKIGSGCVVGAGSIVTKDIPDNSIIVGNPAKIIKER